MSLSKTLSGSQSTGNYGNPEYRFSHDADHFIVDMNGKRKAEDDEDEDDSSKKQKTEDDDDEEEEAAPGETLQSFLIYTCRKVPKVLGRLKTLKLKLRLSKRFHHGLIVPNDTPVLGAVVSGSALFAKIYLFQKYSMF